MEISYENNLGKVVFRRCLVGLSDQWQWNGQVVKHTRTIELDGYVEQADAPEESEGLEPILTARVSGRPGTLVLPWTRLEGIKIQSINMPTGPWLDLEPVQVTFLDERPGQNIYTMSFFGLTLHNPKLTLPIPWRRSTDHHVPMPLATQDTEMGNQVLAYKPLRTREPHDLMPVKLEGTVFLRDVPEGETTTERIHHVVDVIQQRSGTAPHTRDSSLPPGYPRPFHLTQACPELAGQLEIAHLFVEDAQAAWDVEKETLAISLQMLAPPQRVY